jgi:hypothetical protein
MTNIDEAVANFMDYLTYTENTERIRRCLHDTLQIIYTQGKTDGKEEFLDKFIRHIKEA